MRIGCKTGGPGDGVSYRGSHGQTVRVGRSEILYIMSIIYTRECSALWGEPERATEVCCRLSSTVENGTLSLIFRRTWSFAWCRDSVIGERFEVYVRA